MALHHAAPGELISVSPLGGDLLSMSTHAVFKTDMMEVIRIILRAGDRHLQQAFQGELTVQCLEGAVVLHAMGKTLSMKAWDFLYLASGESYSVDAVEDASLLVTMMIEHGQKD